MGFQSAVGLLAAAGIAIIAVNHRGWEESMIAVWLWKWFFSVSMKQLASIKYWLWKVQPSRWSSLTDTDILNNYGSAFIKREQKKRKGKKRQIELCYLFSQSLHAVLLLSKVFSSLSLDPVLSSHLEGEASAICLGVSKLNSVAIGLTTKRWSVWCFHLFCSKDIFISLIKWFAPILNRNKINLQVISKLLWPGCREELPGQVPAGGAWLVEQQWTWLGLWSSGTHLLQHLIVA